MNNIPKIAVAIFAVICIADAASVVASMKRVRDAENRIIALEQWVGRQQNMIDSQQFLLNSQQELLQEVAESHVELIKRTATLR